MNTMLASWKTSLAGLLGGIATTFGIHQVNGHYTVAGVLSGLFIFVMGLLSKDHNVSNAPTPAAPTTVQSS